MKNAQTYILIAFFIVFIWVMTKMNKTMNMQTTLLLGMATKLGIVPPEEDIPSKNIKTEQVETPEQKQLREENELVDYMIAISDEIKAKGKLSKEEKEVYINNFGDMHEDLKLAHPSEIIVDEKENDSDSKEKKKYTPEEKQEIILSFFVDNIPKQLLTITNSFAEKTGLEPNKGNTHGLLKKMVEQKKLVAYKTKESNVFYVLTEWMDKNKLKPEYKKLIV